MNGRRILPQQTLDRLATLYEYADGDPTDGDTQFTNGTSHVMPLLDTAVDGWQRPAESERLLRSMLRAHEGIPVAND